MQEMKIAADATELWRMVLNHYKPTGTPGLRPSTEKSLALIIAWQADGTGSLHNFDIALFAKQCGLSVRTLRRYLSALFESEWLVQCSESDDVRINSKWLENLPPAT